MNNEKKCVQCGKNEKLYKLNSGEYVCKECLDTIQSEQNEIKGYILDYLSENWQIIYPETQAKVLEAIALAIKIENNLLNKKEVEKIFEVKERMEKAFE